MPDFAHGMFIFSLPQLIQTSGVAATPHTRSMSNPDLSANWVSRNFAYVTGVPGLMDGARKAGLPEQ